jgi:hypothetical protein
VSSDDAFVAALIVIVLAILVVGLCLRRYEGIMSRQNKRFPAWLDAELPPAGPCLVCGGPDKRHRVIDAIVGRHAAGETIEALAQDYDLSEAFVARVVKEFS